MDDDLAFLSQLELPQVSFAEPDRSFVEPDDLSAHGKLPDTKPISLLVTDIQIQDWETQALALRAQVSSAEYALRWAEVKYFSFTKQDYEQELARLEVEVNQLAVAEQRVFVKDHKVQRQELIDAMHAIPADHAEFERRVAELTVLKLELTQVEAFIAADLADAQEATLRAQRYDRQYGPT